jgi:hypothetical protein
LTSVDIRHIWGVALEVVPVPSTYTTFEEFKRLETEWNEMISVLLANVSPIQVASACRE